jgi:FMN phosphatase YigB (HAD superfamily)
MNWRPDKLILTDIDGVCLDWEYSFHNWMTRHGYEMQEGGEKEYKIGKRYKTCDGMRLIRMFNESAWIRKLPPLRDAMHYVKKLHQEHGYVFHAITSLSEDDYSQHLRTKNLREMFGDTVFEKFIYLDTGAPKDAVLAKYKDSGLYWLEDKPENCEAGLTVGLRSVLVEHPHNVDYQHPDVIKVKNWQEIYQLITDQSA